MYYVIWSAFSLPFPVTVIPYAFIILVMIILHFLYIPFRVHFPLPCLALCPEGWLCGPCLSSFGDWLAVGFINRRHCGDPGSWRETPQDVSFLLLPSFFPPQLSLLSWIPVEVFPLLIPSALVLEEQLSVFLLHGSLNIPCLFLPLTLPSALYICLSCKSFELSGGEFCFLIGFALMQYFTLLFKKLIAKCNGKTQSVRYPFR